MNPTLNVVFVCRLKMVPTCHSRADPWHRNTTGPPRGHHTCKHIYCHLVNNFFFFFYKTFLCTSDCIRVICSHKEWSFMKFLCMPNYDNTLDQLYNLCLKLFCRVASFFCSESHHSFLRLIKLYTIKICTWSLSTLCLLLILF